MDIRPIRSETDYKLALQAVEPWFDHEPDPDSDEGARFDVLITLIEAWERKQYPVLPPDPIEAIRFRMEQQGLGVADLEPMIGQRNRVYEVLAGRRSLTLPMIRRLHAQPGIPAEVLIGAPDAEDSLA